MSRTIVSRRNALRSAGLALAAPVIGSLPTARAATISVAPNAKSTPVKVSTDLAAWAMDLLGTASGASLSGTATPTHFVNASGAMRLCARHMESTGINPLVMYQAGQRDLSNIDFSSHPSQKAAYEVAKKYMPNLTSDDVARHYAMSADQIKDTQSRMKRRGISGHYDALADALQSSANALKVRPSYAAYNRQQKGARLDIGNYNPRHMPSVVRTCTVKQATCAALSNPHANDAVAAILGIALTDISVMGATAFCASETALAIASDVLTAGWALLASPLEAAICVGTETGAA